MPAAWCCCNFCRHFVYLPLCRLFRSNTKRPPVTARDGALHVRTARRLLLPPPPPLAPLAAPLPPASSRAARSRAAQAPHRSLARVHSGALPTHDLHHEEGRIDWLALSFTFASQSTSASSVPLPVFGTVTTIHRHCHSATLYYSWPSSPAGPAYSSLLKSTSRKAVLDTAMTVQFTLRRPIR